jgi:hypothetical protein
LKYAHIKTVLDCQATQIARNETDLIAALNRYLSHPEYDAAAREKLIEIEVCQPIAGISKRITDELLQWM